MRTKERQDQRFYSLMLLPAVVISGLFVLYPIIYNIHLSFFDVNMMTILRERPFIGFKNYTDIFSHSDFMPILNNTIIFTLGSIVFQFLFGFALAIFFLQNFKFSQFGRACIVMGWVLSPIIVGTIWRWIFNTDYGLLNFFLKAFLGFERGVPWIVAPEVALTAVIIANIWLGIPFNMMLLTGGLSSLPGEIYEAARIDGANGLSQFFLLTLPLMKQTIGATLTLGFIYTFRVFALIWVMTSGGPIIATTTFPLWSYRLSFDLFQFGQGAAVSNILLLIMLIFTILYIKLFAQGEAK